MPARIIETNSSPFQRIDVDTVTVDIIENALRNAREEMDAVLFRTAMSPGIREQGDCFPMIANREGKMVVGQFGSFIHGFTEAYDAELEEGDIILTNDPYLCNAAVSHLPDWIVLVPIFKDGRHIAWSAMFGHMSDNGGMVPGSIPIQAETIFQEGIRIPPTKLYKKGELQSDVLELILHNVRTPQWNRFDLNALVAACNTAAKRCVEMAERFGDDTFYTTMEIMLERNHMAMEAIINMLVPGRAARVRGLRVRRRGGHGPLQDQVQNVARRLESHLRFRRHRSAGTEFDQLLPERRHVQDVFRFLHDQPGGSADPVQRRFLRPGRCADSAGHAAEAQLPGGTCPGAPTRWAVFST